MVLLQLPLLQPPLLLLLLPPPLLLLLLPPPLLLLLFTFWVHLLAEQQQSHILPVSIMHYALGLWQVKGEPAAASKG
jgi:hypothetical protein